MAKRAGKSRQKRTYQGSILNEPPPPAVAEVIEKYRGDAEAVIPALAEIQQAEGYLKKKSVAHAAHAMHVHFAQVYGTATFYTMLHTDPATENIIRVCDGPACWLHRAGDVMTALKTALGAGWTVERSSCLGLCDHAPAALVNDHRQITLDPADPKAVVETSPAHPHTYTHPRPNETRVLLANTDKIDPRNIETALAHGAYQGLTAALERSPKEVVAEVTASNLRGRGGAGFPTGMKWKFVAEAADETRYIVCNADESEPLVFKDRVLMDSNPHLLLEGMAIAGYAIGAREGYIYIRGEYAAQADVLELAIRQAMERGKLGDNIAGSEFSFHIHVHRGAGAYICGEETALLESLEGRRGEPRMRPPYPTVSGFRGKPTVVNNVETFANVPAILRHGAQWYNELSPGDGRAGTKLYTLLGHVNHPGLFEAPFGLTLRQIIDDFGDGMKAGSTFNMALTGGAAGTIVNRDFLDVPIDYASARAHGISLGAGAFLIADESVSPVDLLGELLHFFESESCGKCTPCRIGTRRTRQLLDGMRAGNFGVADTDTLAQMADTLKYASFCGLGQSVAIPMQSALKNFPQAFRK